MSDDKIEGIVYSVIALIFIVVVYSVIYTEYKECSAIGGELVRGILGGVKCIK